MRLQRILEAQAQSRQLRSRRRNLGRGLTNLGARTNAGGSGSCYTMQHSMIANRIRSSRLVPVALAFFTSLALGCSSDDGSGPLDSATFSTDEDVALTENLALALEVDGEATYAITTQPASGTASVDATGSLSYTPDADANGSDSLVVSIVQGSSDYEAAIDITVLPINDAPVAVIGQLSVEAGSPIEGVLIGTDVDGDTLTYEVVTDPSLGTVSAFDAATGAFTYTPTTAAFGPDTLAFVAKDASETSPMVNFDFVVSALLNIPTGAGVEPPATLLATGLFVGPPIDLVPNAGLIPFELNQRLWTDWAAKTRLIFVPDGQTIDFDATGPFMFPVGTFFVKHFQIEISAGVQRNIETRVFLLKEEADVGVENWVGYTYQWNAAGDDADLVPDTQVEAIIVDGNLDPPGIAIDATAEGGARTQQYEIPSRGQCLICHDQSVGFVRGFRALNLNRDVGGSNQLTSLGALNIFSATIPDPTTIGAYSNITDTTATDEERTRSYLAVNCAHCHNPTGFCSQVPFDLRYSEWNNAAGLSLLISSGRITPQNTAGSNVFTRMSAGDGTPNTTAAIRPRMPLIQSNFVDDDVIAVLTDFINGLP